MKKFKVVGWDNGYDFEKIVTQNSKIKFPSVVHRPNKIQDILPDEDKSFNKERMIIEYNNSIYFIGKYAIYNAPGGGNKNYEKGKIMTATEKAKFLSGMSLITNDNEIYISKLITGLPVSNYFNLKDKVVEHFKENNRFKYKIKGNSKELFINKVICIPQGVGAYYDQTLNIQGKIKENNLLNKRYGLIDIGGNTIDSFIGEGLSPVNGTQIGLSYGLSDAFKGVHEEAYNLIENNFLEEKDTLVYDNQEINNIMKKCRDNFKILVEEVYEEIIDKWNRQLPRVEVIILTGGGSKAIGKYFKQKISKECIIVDNPIFSNANGYYKLGIRESKEDNNA